MDRLILDENLILRTGGGDLAAFRDLYAQTSSVVYGFALSILRNSYDAEDVMHDAFIKIYSCADTYQPMGKPLAWILTIVKNLCRNRLRAGHVIEDTDALLHMPEPSASSFNADAVLDKITLQKALEVLDSQERQIVVLHALTGLKHREIAQILDLPIGTVLSKYKRSLRKLREAI